MNTTPKRVIVALDVARLDLALALADRLDPAACRVKIGKELFTRAGPPAVRALIDRGFDVFLDLKFYDIPNTVAGACRAAADMGCWMIDVHAGGGPAMLAAARKAVGDSGQPLLIGVTVLTSLDAAALEAIGVHHSVMEQVSRLAGLAVESGLDGVVCSPLEITGLRRQTGPGFILVTPGVRPAGAPRGDQVRVATPAEAVLAGADFLVVGRPVTQSPNPIEVVSAINLECSAAAASANLRGD